MNSRRNEVNSELMRIISALDNDLFQICQTIKTSGKGPHIGTDVTGPYWIFGLVTVKKGTFQFLQGSSATRVEERYFSMYLPPFSIVQVSLRDAVTLNIGFASKTKPPPGFPIKPVLFCPSDSKIPTSINDIAQIMESRHNVQTISRESDPCALSIRAKRMISDSYKTETKISSIASKLKTSSAVLSRYFKRDFGLTPIQYKKRLQLTEAMLELMEGKAVIEVAQKMVSMISAIFMSSSKKLAAHRLRSIA